MEFFSMFFFLMKQTDKEKSWNYLNILELSINSFFDAVCSITKQLSFSEAEFRINVTLLCSTLYYVVLYIPILTIDLVVLGIKSNGAGADVDAHDDQVSLIADSIAIAIYIIPYSTNWLIYVSRNDQFRRAYLQYFQEWKEFFNSIF